MALVATRVVPYFYLLLLIRYKSERSVCISTPESRSTKGKILIFCFFTFFRGRRIRDSE